MNPLSQLKRNVKSAFAVTVLQSCGNFMLKTLYLYNIESLYNIYIYIYIYNTCIIYNICLYNVCEKNLFL